MRSHGAGRDISWEKKNCGQSLLRWTGISMSTRPMIYSMFKIKENIIHDAFITLGEQKKKKKTNLKRNHTT